MTNQAQLLPGGRSALPAASTSELFASERPSARPGDSVHRWTQSSLRDPSVLAIIADVFLIASAIACLLPARRAARIGPKVALRDS